MLTLETLTSLITAALEEDAPWGDVTTENLVPASAEGQARLVAREVGVFAGAPIVGATFGATDPNAQTKMHIADGTRFEAGDVLATITSSVWGLLRAERVALNFVQRMSGTATRTRRYVEAIDGTQARIVDTRKTTPGLRILEKYAVRCGGGGNHRFSLSDAVLVKDNHLAALSTSGADVVAVLQALRTRIPFTTSIEVEVDTLDQLEAVLAAQVVDSIQLDNFDVETTREAVRIISGRTLVHASGGITLTNVRAVAETGVDLISVGALTHSAGSVDLALDMDF